MKKLLFAFALILLPSCANAQCNGIFPPSTLCGNLSASPAPAKPFSSSGGVFGPGSTVVGDIAIWNNVGGVLLADGGTITTYLNTACQIAAQRPTCAALLGYYDVSWWGAKCDSVTDDTAAIQAALTAVPEQGTLIFPSGTGCIVSGSGATIFTRTTAITLNLNGATIVATAGASTDIFLFQPTDNACHRPWHVTNGIIVIISGGRHVLHISTQGSNTKCIAEFLVDRIQDTPSGNAAGYSIYVDNPVTNTNGGTFNSYFEKNVFTNGIVLSNAGDSFRIRDNILTGTKYGIYLNIAVGGGGILISGNNITAAAQLVVDNAQGVLAIDNNEFEQSVTNTTPNNAVIDIIGGTSTIQFLKFTGNSVLVLASTGDPTPLRVFNTAYAVIETNSIIAHTAGNFCFISSVGLAVVGSLNEFRTCTTPVSVAAGVFQWTQTSDVRIVANLPPCNATYQGVRFFVTDSNSTTFHATVATGGSNKVGVICDGTNWYID